MLAAPLHGTKNKSTKHGPQIFELFLLGWRSLAAKERESSRHLATAKCHGSKYRNSRDALSVQIQFRALPSSRSL